MGYACPVCEIPHQDATHLANHLAFTAMTHGDDHEAWLDDQVPGWVEYGEAELAGEVAAVAPEAEYDRVFEDTVHGGGEGRHRHDDRDGDHTPHGQEGIDPGAAAAAGRGTLDEETRAVLDEARGLTAAMLDEGDSADGGQSDDADDGRSDGADDSQPDGANDGRSDGADSGQSDDADGDD